METEEIAITDKGIVVTPRPPAAPAKPIKASELAVRWGCTKAYLSKIKASHGLDTSTFTTLDDADDWLRKTLPHLYDKYTSAGASKPTSKPAKATTKAAKPPAPPAPPPSAPPSSLPPAPTLPPSTAVVAGEEDFFDIHIARARVASEIAFETYMRENAAGSHPRVISEALKNWNDASASYTRLKTLNVKFQSQAAMLVPTDRVKGVLQDVITTWITLLDRFDTRVSCSPDTKVRIKKAIEEMKGELVTALPKALEALRGVETAEEDEDDDDK